MSLSARGVILTRYPMLLAHPFIELLQGNSFSVFGLGHPFANGRNSFKLFRHLEKFLIGIRILNDDLRPAVHG